MVFIFFPSKQHKNIFKKEGKLTAIGVQLFDPTKMVDVKTELEKLPRKTYVVPSEQMSKEILIVGWGH